MTLERLEIALYKAGLASFSASDFSSAGYPDWVRYRFSEVIAEEDQHISFISGAIAANGATPVPACKYSFPYTDISSWLTLVQSIDGVGRK